MRIGDVFLFWRRPAGKMVGDCGIADNMAVSDDVHLLIPFAGGAAGGYAEALRGLALPHLRKLLARLAPAAGFEGALDSYSLPHERVLARAWGLEAGDGELPLAAAHLRQSGRDPGAAAWAWITPCHLRLGSDRLFLTPPQQLALDAHDSQALLAAMAPYFAEDGLQLEYVEPARWLAHGAPLAGLRTAAPDRAAGRNVEPWMPAGPTARTLRRLQQEMQMLLYTLPLNDARQAAGRLPVNSFWVSGSGAWPAQVQATAGSTPRVDERLREAALQGDWPAWAAHWRDLDATVCAALLQDAQSGRKVTLTLSGERNARSWSSAAGGGLLRRLRGLVQAPNPIALLESL